jgi:hypothetical protein
MSNDDLAEFAALVRKAGSAPMIDLTRCMGERWPTRRETVTLRDFSRVYAPWYETADGRETSYDDPHGRPLSIDRAAQVFRSLSHKDRFDYPIEQLSKGAIPATILPAYKLPRSNLLLLDGNHRTVAIAHLKLSVPVDLIVCDGPMEESALWDLKYWIDKV